VGKGGGAIVFKFQNTGDVSSTSPSSLIAKKVSIVKITGFSTTKGLYPGMQNPTFKRVQDEKSIDRENKIKDETSTGEQI
jgi:hypothetical protein